LVVTPDAKEGPRVACLMGCPNGGGFKKKGHTGGVLEK